MSKTKNKSRSLKKLENVLQDSEVYNDVNVMQRSLSHEDAIRKQFNRIQKDYSRLMDDISTEYTLIKEWIFEQIDEKKQSIREKLN